MDDIEHSDNKKIELPNYWWKLPAVSSKFLEYVEHHILGILLAVYRGTDFRYSVYSGLPLFYKNSLFWITAGHVIDELKIVLTSPEYRIEKLCWLDGYKIKGAEAVLFHRRDLLMSSWKEKGIDFGVMKISLLDTKMLLNNERVKPIIPYIWENPANIIPEGYYGVGYPRSWSTHDLKKVNYKQLLHTINAAPICLPLEKINWEVKETDNECWKKETSFIGRILQYPDYPGFPIENIKGMSGGPIISINRSNSGGFVYRLIGIISQCNAQQQYLCAESIMEIKSLLMDWVEINLA
jgi:hypothetical protein